MTQDRAVGRPDQGSPNGDAGRRRAQYSAKGVALAARRLDMALAGMHAGLSGMLGITTLEILAIEHLGMDGAMGPSELARRLHVTTGATTALVDRLAEGGYVVRRPHPGDRRRLLVELTQHARDQAHIHVYSMVDEVVALARRLTDDERQTVVRFLDRLADIMRRYPAGSPG